MVTPLSPASVVTFIEDRLGANDQIGVTGSISEVLQDGKNNVADLQGQQNAVVEACDNNQTAVQGTDNDLLIERSGTISLE